MSPSSYMTGESELVGILGLIVLDRPKTLNSLSMVKDLFE
jgi:hypothetical protein